MAATPLIVPIAVDALLANNAYADQITTIRPDWDQLRQHTPIEPSTTVHEPYDGSASGDDRFSTDQMGIFLQWELPAGLRTARPNPQDPTAPPDFPKIPNRWLVLRHHRQKSNKSAPPQVCGWFIRSDVDADDHDYDAAILPSEPDEDSAGYPVNKTYGQVYALHDEETEIPPEDDPSVPKKPFLTAGSAILPAFTQYRPYNQNIFSFHDTWESLTEAQANLAPNELTLSYLVAGWYSATDIDPVNSTSSSALTALLRDLGWMVKEGLELPSADTAEHSIYAGTVMAMPWHTDLDLANTEYKNTTTQASSRPDGRPSVAEVTPVLGHSSIEAQAALLAVQNLKDWEVALFEAFQYHLLDNSPQPNTPTHTAEPLADYALGFARHDFSFTSTSGGTTWQLIPTVTTPPPTPPSPAQSEALKELNTAQAAYDQTALQLRDLTTRLKGLWWLTTPQDSTPETNIKSTMDALATSITNCLTNMETQLKKIPSGKSADELANSIRDWSKKNDIPEAYELRPIPRPPFRSVNNPVVILQNLQDPERTAEIDGYLGGLLTVRPASTAQLTSGTGPPLTGTAHSNYSSTDVIPARVASYLAALYDEFSDLESLAFKNEDTKKEAYKDLADILKVEAPQRYIPPYTRWWRQPWLPTFMQWKAKLYPTPLDHYEFTERTDSGRFEYLHRTNVAVEKQTQDQPREVSGYTWIAPVIEAHTRYMLEYTKNADLHFNSPEYGSLADSIKENSWDVLSFSLSGINEALAGRRTDIGMPTRTGEGTTFTYQLPPGETGYALPPEVAGTVVPHLPLFPAETDDGCHDGDVKAQGSGSFSKISSSARSAQVCLTELTITDSFGRTLKVLRAEDRGRPVITAPSLKVTSGTLSYTHPSGDTDTEPPVRLVELTPRLHRGARLLLEHLDQTGAPTTPGVNPVHAWLMATRLGLRRALLCYTPTGQPLFQIYCTDDGSPRCRALPSSPYTSITDAAFSSSHPQLSGFLTPLLTTPSPATGKPLQEFLHSLDHSLTTIAPPTPRSPDSSPSSLLMGRPCALVTTRLRLELDGPPLREPTIAGLAADTAPGDTATWPVRLGDPLLVRDGLIGYFTSGDYTQFHSYHSGSTAKYTMPITPDSLSLTPQDATNLKPADDLTLTLLVCPDHPVHAVTDILPAAQLTLPATVIDQALSTIRPAFPLGPVLTAVKDPTGNALTMPVPTLGTDHSTWVWTQSDPDKSPPWTQYPINSPQPTDEAPAPTAEARTGYLQLIPEST
ncbi:hypothetical protein [Streptomyces sp. NPDC055709]